MKSFILFTVSAVLLGLLLVPFNNKNNDGVAVVCALDVKRILHQTMPTSSKEHQQQHEKHEKHEKHIHHSKKAPGWEKALKKDSKSKSKSTNSKSVKSKLVKSKSTKSKSTTYAPTKTPTNAPTNAPTNVPTDSPTHVPTNAPTNTPTNAPTNTPTNAPTNVPTDAPTNIPTNAPTNTPTIAPTGSPSDAPTKEEQSIAEIICDPDNADVFRLLCEALSETDLLRMLLDDQGDDTYTLFAPNNSAISKLNEDKADAMQQILLTHMLVGEVSYNELVCKSSYNMVNDQPTTTTCGFPRPNSTKRKYQVGEGNGSSNKAMISLSNINIQATNGIIHEINRVIFPDLK